VRDEHQERGEKHMTTSVVSTKRSVRSGLPLRTASLKIANSLVIRILVRRLSRLLSVLVVLVVATFALLRLVPGDPARNAVGMNADTVAYEQARDMMHLDESLLAQFGYYVWDIVHFDFGTSYATDQPVTAVIAERLPGTLELTVLAISIALLTAVPLGLYVATATYGKKRWLRTAFTSVTGAFGGLPHYVIATLLVFLFAITWRWLPPSGSGSLKYALLPALAMAARPAAMLARIVRVEATRVLGQDYVRTARSKRLPGYLVIARHVLPNVLTPTLAVTGTLVAGLISGAVIIEQVFARPGLGSELVQAVLAGNYPVVQGITILLGIIVVVVNTLVDLVLALVDPQAAAGADR
jgi:peptide/nickel transport system permease protein